MRKINIDDSLYPTKLKNISNPPLSLYIEGNLELLNSKSLAIIGSRSASKSGKLLAEKFSSELSKVGITIISGLATGIDTVAHLYSLSERGKTIAVLGSGFNKIFPKENVSLLDDILNNNGLIISEYSPNEEAKYDNFVQRNRIISGLSIGILIIEAQFRSGTSITANYAIEQEKPIFTLPHEIWETNGVGTNRLIKKGAQLITDTSDILEYLNLEEYKLIYNNLKKAKMFESYTRRSIRKTIEISQKRAIKATLKKSKKALSNSARKSIAQNQKLTDSIEKDLNKLDSKQLKIYTIIKNSNKAISMNEIACNSNIAINEVLSILFILEVNGFVKKSSGGYICI